ncbi:MAG: GMC family oxidoreductase, partial [Deltaproteobacteria bacterium]|nr:GMC family oxidoreductase [Deltaproteobacteria bacterium]
MSVGRQEQGTLPPEYSLDYPNVESGLDLAPRLSSPRVYHADAVVVGSGAGGAPVAARLRDAGLDVLLLEEGGLYRTADFVTDPLESARRMYRDAGT